MSETRRYKNEAKRGSSAYETYIRYFSTLTQQECNILEITTYDDVIIIYAYSRRNYSDILNKGRRILEAVRLEKDRGLRWTE